MHKVHNCQTGEITTTALTAENIAEQEAFIRDELPELLRQRVQNSRAAAYATEADPLFFKAQRGEATMDEWNAKVAEIRARYPYGGE